MCSKIIKKNLAYTIYKKAIFKSFLIHRKIVRKKTCMKIYAKFVIKQNNIENVKCLNEIPKRKYEIYLKTKYTKKK